MKCIRFVAALFLTFCFGCGGGGSGGDGGGDLSNNACAAAGLGTRIINGTACTEQGSPVVRVRLLGGDGSVSLCSGTMITSDDVLTAAHCFFGNIVAARVSAGDQSSAVAQVVLHPQVSANNDVLAVFNDAAIVQLTNPLNLPTLPLVGSRDAKDGDTISIFGYGLDENQGIDVLRAGEMQVSEVTPNHIFANFNGNGSNTCNGDSGGPALLSVGGGNGIVGLVSSGNLVTCEPGDLSLFSNAQGSSIFDFVMSVVPDAGVI